MGYFSHFLYPWGLILQGIAVIHFIRRRPDNYWIWVILFLGPIGALVYLFAEAIPDLGLLRGTLKVFPRRKRIRELEIAVRDNPSAGNYEELGDLYLEDSKLQQARAAFDKAIAARASTVGPLYGRGVCAILLNDAAAALPDLQQVVQKEPRYDFDRAAGLLAHAYAQTGQKETAEALFRQVIARSTSSETYLNFADLLPPKDALLRLASGPSESSTSARRFPAISVAVSAHGSAAPGSYSSNCPPESSAFDPLP